MALAALALVGVFVASYLTLYKIGKIGELTCSIGSCETVNTSTWSVLLGVPVAAWGVAFYLAALVVAILSLQTRFADSSAPAAALAVMSGIGVAFSIFLTYLELFVIHAICIWCVTSAVIVSVMFVLSVIDWRAGPPAATEYDQGVGGDSVGATPAGAAEPLPRR